jgi:hypothetical protein
MKNLNDLLAAARRVSPPAATPESRADFARQTIAAWKRSPDAQKFSRTELSWLWLRAGFCSVTAAAAVVLALAVVHPMPTRAAHNPFDLVLSEPDNDPLF